MSLQVLYICCIRRCNLQVNPAAHYVDPQQTTLPNGETLAQEFDKWQREMHYDSGPSSHWQYLVVNLWIGQA